MGGNIVKMTPVDPLQEAGNSFNRKHKIQQGSDIHKINEAIV